MLKETEYKIHIGTIDDFWWLLATLKSLRMSLNDLYSLAAQKLSRIHDYDSMLSILNHLNIIEFDNNFVFCKKSYNDIKVFKESFNKLILKKLKENEEWTHFFCSEIQYDVTMQSYFIYHIGVPHAYAGLRNLLVSSSLFTKSNEKLYINSDYINYFKNHRKITLDQLLKNNEKKLETGRKGELFVFNFEKRRLKLGHSPKNHMIKIISEIDVTAGYDIVSLNSTFSEYNDRFIEVKTFSERKQFFITRNELATSREYRDNYYLYLVNLNRIDDENYYPEIIQNPLETILKDENTDWIIENETIKLTKI